VLFDNKARAINGASRRWSSAIANCTQSRSLRQGVADAIDKSLGGIVPNP